MEFKFHWLGGKFPIFNAFVVPGYRELTTPIHITARNNLTDLNGQGDLKSPLLP